MTDLRDYQNKVIRDIYREWRSGKRCVLLAMPTGSGKTRTFSEIALDFVNRQEQVMLLVHREELLLQAQQTLERITKMPVGTIKAGQPLKLDRLIQCASVQTLVKRLEKQQLELPHVSLTIVDEAHLSLAPSYLKILDSLPQSPCFRCNGYALAAGWPWLRSRLRSLSLGPSVSELIWHGYLADYDVLAPDSFLPQEGVRITGGDFNAGDLATQIDRRYVAGRAIDAYLKHAVGKRCVVFAINIDHAKAIAASYQEAGIAAEHIDSETPTKERRAILARFRSGTTKVLTNVNLFTEGFDLPEIEVVQLCRPTQSVALHLQMVGRGLRPKSTGKALILDHAGNCLRLGGPKATRSWTLQGIADEQINKAAIAMPQPSSPILLLPQFPKRQTEIFETSSTFHHIPTNAELETQLANAAYREPQVSSQSYGQSSDLYSHSTQTPHSQTTKRRRPRQQSTPSPHQKTGVVRQIGKAALELAEMLESILTWVWQWFRPRTNQRRRGQRYRHVMRQK
ncbi:MAG: DEAD/DEAH box helicase [Pseudanabaena sp. SU_2_4]|nr:DEAD/DEAH box helicase [Pseudanabaena sp. SU_2_4]